MSDSFLYSGDDAAMMSELQRCHVAVRQHRMYMLKSCSCIYVNPYLTLCDNWMEAFWTLAPTRS